MLCVRACACVRERPDSSLLNIPCRSVQCQTEEAEAAAGTTETKVYMRGARAHARCVILCCSDTLRCFVYHQQHSWRSLLTVMLHNEKEEDAADSLTRAHTHPKGLRTKINVPTLLVKCRLTPVGMCENILT